MLTHHTLEPIHGEIAAEEPRSLLRHSLAELTAVLLGIAVGAGMLALYLLALAWDPIDRRLGLHARRRVERHALLVEEGLAALVSDTRPRLRTVGVLPSPSGVDQ